MTTVWSDVLFGECQTWIHDEAERRSCDLHLLTDIDVSWVADSVRYLPNERRSFFERCEAELRRRRRPYELVRGNWDERFVIAERAIERILNSSPPILG